MEIQEAAGDVKNEPPQTAAVAPGYYRPELDGLRFLAFLLVFLHHALPQTEVDWEGFGLHTGLARWLAAFALAGANGVDVFFCLSAFLITELLLRERDASGRISTWRFYVRRVLRIWPLYVGFLAFTFAVLKRTMGDGLTWGFLTAFLLFVGNWKIALAGHYGGSVAAPLWSVSLEEQVYLVQPVLVRLASSLKRGLTVVGLLLATAVATRWFLITVGAKHPAMWVNTLARLDPVALGMALAYCLHGRNPRTSPWLARATLLGSVAALVIVARLAPVTTAPLSYEQLWGYFLVALASTAAIFATLASRTHVLLTHEWVVFLGKISYGLYVFHYLGINRAARLLALPLLGGIENKWARLGLVAGVGLTLTTIAAVLSWYLLESPFLRLKRRFARVASRPD